MADRKRKNRDGQNNDIAKKSNHNNNKHQNPKPKKKGGRGKTSRSGPHLPNSLRREIELLNPKPDPSISDEDIDSDDAANDLYEYEEAPPQEESRKNRRYDPVENYEYQLPDEFKDENVESDDEDEDFGGKLEDGFEEEEDEGRHVRMLQEITGLPGEAFEAKKRKKNVVVSEAYPENEYNPTRDVLDGDGSISIQDLLEPLHGKSGFTKLKNNMQRMERNSMAMHAPLSKTEREQLERRVAYEKSKKEITKWEPLVKRNREAPTIYFDEDTELNFSTVGAIASEFEPRTAFEKQMAALVSNDEVAEAYRNDGARLLELNKISIEDVKERQDRLAKMRNLLFRHEMKAKRVKKIKSKTYHRLLKKDRLKAVASQIEGDPEAAKELAKKQELKRLEERLTLKHKNNSKWAKRILNRGLSVQDDETRAAIHEQLHQHALLTRKINTMKDDSSSDESSGDDDDDSSAGSDEEDASKLLERAKKKTLKAIEDEEMPKSGVFSLPFMTRGLKKSKEAAEEEAMVALHEYDSSLKQLEDKSNTGSPKLSTSSGRRVFGAPKQQVQESNKKIRSDNFYGDSDSEGEFETKEDVEVGHARRNHMLKDITVDSNVLRDESEISHDNVLKSFEEIVKDPGPKTTCEVAIFVADSWKKKKNLPESSEKTANKNERITNGKNSSNLVDPISVDNREELESGSDTDGEVGMVDGILTALNKTTYELPSQADLIRRAFAADDVEGEFEKVKEDILNEENPEPEKPVLLPGWGQWTHVQKKRGLPSWMLEEHENAKKKREETLKKRKDAHLKNVIISEKVDKKAEKLHTKTLPYPYTSKKVFEQSIRMPIGPEFNPATAIGALNRPTVVKKSGVMIKPIKYEDVDPYGKTEEHKRSVKKQSGKRRKNKN